jgi:hypothetical protein
MSIGPMAQLDKFLKAWLPFIPLDPIRSHPRYHALLRKMNLKP